MRLSCLYDDPRVKSVLLEAEKADAERMAKLTPAQLAVLPMLVDGLSNKAAAHAAGISQRTLETHRAAIMERTGCNTFAELVRLYARAG